MSLSTLSDHVHVVSRQPLCISDRRWMQLSDRPFEKNLGDVQVLTFQKWRLLLIKRNVADVKANQVWLDHLAVRFHHEQWAGSLGY